MTSPLELVGFWSLQRRMLDRRSAVHYAMDGTLTLARDGAVVRWSEHGELRWDGGRAEVGREYLIVPSADGWELRFDDGRSFVPWAPGRFVDHPCRADRYRGLIDVDATATRLRVWWDVVGPAKHQRIVTRCRRGTTAAAAARPAGHR